MAVEKILNSRLLLKYDTLAAWQSSPFNGDDASKYLKAGEAAVVLVNTWKLDADGNQIAVPTCLMKIGDGKTKFDNLNWIAAQAADVYDWAKKAAPDWDDFGILPTDKLPQIPEELLPEIPAELLPEITATGDDEITLTANGHALTAEHTAHAAGSAKTDSTKTISGYDATGSIKIPKIVTNAAGHVTEIREETVSITMPSEQDTGVMSVSGKEAIKTDGDDTVEVSLALDNSGNVVLSQSDNGLKAVIDLSEYRKIVDDEDTQFGLEYDSNAKQIKIVANGGDSYIDASDFIADGMLESVVANQEKNTLTFTWNTDGNKTATTVNLSEIADIYTGVANDDITVSVSNDNKISATLNKSYALASELNGYKTKQSVVNNPTASGSALAFIDTISQNANGEITVTKKNVNLTDYALKSELPVVPDVNDGQFTVSGIGALEGTGSMTANQAGSSAANLDIKNKGVSAEKTKAYIENYGDSSEEVWVFYSGTSTILV